MHIKKSLRIAIPALLLATATTGHAESAATVVANELKAMTPLVVGVCIGAIDSNGVSSVQCGGETVLNTGIVPTTQSTLFAIGSITKTMTATDLAVAMQTNSNLLNADLSTTYIPYTIPAGKLTVLDLADEHSGLPRDYQDNRLPYNPPPNLFADLLDVQWCLGQPDHACWNGKGPAYSNVGYGLLGAIVTDALGFGNWAVATETTVLAPLGMTQTGVEAFWKPDVFAARAAQGFSSSSGSFVRVDTTMHLNKLGFGGQAAGALWSTGNDMQTWLKYNMGEINPPAIPLALSLARYDLYQEQACYTAGSNTCQPTGFTGLAWETLSTPKGASMVSKDGKLGGFSSFMAFEQFNGRGAWVMVNSDGLTSIKNDVGGMLDKLD